jgi:putative selenium metabolism hydrolase
MYQNIAECVKDELINFTRNIVKIPSFTGQEKEVAEIILASLQRWGIEESWIDEIGNVVGVIRGSGKGPNILFNGHMDIAPIGRMGDWIYDPFSAYLDGQGNIYGRGTTDMKGGLSAILFLMRILQEKVNKGIEMPGDVIFSAVVSEEAAEMLGMEYLCKTTLPQKGICYDVCFLAEPTSGKVNIGQRGKVEIVIETQGKIAHSSRPWQGINALEKMLPILDAVFNKLGPNLPDHPELGKCSITVTNILCRPGSFSIIPDECEISVDRRYVPGETPETILQEFSMLIDEIHKKDAEFIAKKSIRSILETSYTGYKKAAQKHHPVWLVDKDNVYVVKTREALREMNLPDNVGYFIGGVDGGMTAGLLGIPTIGFSCADELLAHTTNEYVNVKSILSDLEGYVEIISKLYHL